MKKAEAKFMKQVKKDIAILHGGKRKGAGRKPLPKGERKIGLTIYISESIVKKCGGEYFAKSLMEDCLLSKARKN